MRNVGQAVTESYESIKIFLATSLAKTVGVAVAEINGASTFSELGLDSTLSVRWLQVINSHFRLSLSFARLFDYPTIAQLSEYLKQQLLSAKIQQDQDFANARRPHKKTAQMRQVEVAERLSSIKHSEVGTLQTFGEIELSTVRPSSPNDEGIAVVGMACQFPKARNVADYWRNLTLELDCVTEVPSDRWIVEEFYSTDRSMPGKTYSKWMGALEDDECFDARFFNISAAEAEWMDPRQRLFLQNCWNCIEDAGIDADSLSGTQVGVFVGCKHGDYGKSLSGDHWNAYAYLGESSSILAGRVSYYLNLKGPSIAIDTACSSSLVAVSQACDSLLLNRIDAALAGGVCLLSGPAMHVMSAKANMLSPDGRCFVFDTRANGIVPGEGVGVVLLKRLSDAISDGDRIDGVIRGSGVNQDGKTNGITAPSMNAQKDLQLSVYEQCGINPRTISFVEAHGTGTSLGDPIELEALISSFSSYTSAKQFCAIGSVKSNIGHLLAAAGIASLIKVLLALRHKKLPPTINFKTLNERIDLDNSPFYICDALRSWDVDYGQPRRAAINSFGFSGTNAHMIVEEYVSEREANSRPIQPTIILLSAMRPEQLTAQLSQLREALISLELTDFDLSDVGFTLQTGRREMEHRAALVVRTKQELAIKLSRLIAGETEIEDCYVGSVQPTKSHSAQHYARDDLDDICDAWIAREALQNWVRNYSDSRFLAQWVAGMNFDWRQIYEGCRPRRISLPTYPFEKRRYKLVDRPATSSNVPEIIKTASIATASTSLLRNANQISILDAEIALEGRTISLLNHVSNKVSEEISAISVGIPPLNSSVPDARLTIDIHAILIGEVVDVLKASREDVALDVELSNLGFDSISLVELTNRLNRKYELDMTPVVFFDNPTLRKAADFLLNVHSKKIVMESTSSFRSCSTTVALSRDDVVIQLSSDASESSQCDVPKLSTLEPIAIIGISACFPQAVDTNQFWLNLLEGKDSVTEVPIDRWNWRDHSDDDSQTGVRWGAFIESLAEFDPLFFGISPREAALMDPQQRLLMTHAWKVIEDAGYSPQSLSGTRTAVFVGTGGSAYSNGYNTLMMRAETPSEGYIATSIVPSVGPNRISYFLNLRGPSEPVETACSSSLVAIHRAVLAMRNDNCEMAIVGGVNTMVTPHTHLNFTKAGMLSGDGRCKTFSADANGYVRGEGIGLLLLKQLTVAERDHDHIYAVIRGSAENHGGRANSFTAPNPAAQSDLLKAAYRQAGVDPRTIGYIEAHGTGTALGDPIEIEGLKIAFRQLYESTGSVSIASEHCGLGSVKTNIGHLELAAGIAGMIKVILQLQHKTLVKTLHCERLNPYIQLNNSPFYIVRDNKPWESVNDSYGNALPRRAGVSSFGFGGVNAHVVVEEYLQKDNTETRPDPHCDESAIFVLSAKTNQALHAQACNLIQTVKLRHIHFDAFLDIAFTLQIGREAMDHRLGFVANSVEELIVKLEKYLHAEGASVAGLYQGIVKRSTRSIALLNEDAGLTMLTKQWFASRQFEKMIELWCAGLNIDWQAVRGPVNRRRISLPTYPFAKERYWIATQSAKNQFDSIAPRAFTASVPDQTTFLVQKWEDMSEVADAAFPRGDVERWIVLCRPSDESNLEIDAWTSDLKSAFQSMRVHLIASTHSEVDRRFCDLATRIFEIVHQILKDKSRKEVLLQIVVVDPDESFLGGIEGLLKVAHLENPRFFGQIIELDRNPTIADLIKQIDYCALHAQRSRIRYHAHKRMAIKWIDIEMESIKPVHPWKAGGVYLITGGGGSLGSVFTKEIISRCDSARIILAGRSKPNQARASAINPVCDKQAQVEYMSLDVTDPTAVDELVRDIVARFGSLDGVLHCAGINRDGYLIRKTGEQFGEVLSAKTAGTANLDRSTAHLPLDFFVVFSSISSVFPVAGQGDYSCANGFMDVYARQRNALIELGQRQGRTLSINWPLWKDGGMRIPDENRDRFEQEGKTPLTTQAGIHAFYSAFAMNHPQVAVLCGDRQILKTLWQRQYNIDRLFVSGTNDASKEQRHLTVSIETIERRTLKRLKELFARATKAELAKIDEDEPFETYGIDSLLIAVLNKGLSSVFGRISKTLFYEYRCIRELCDYLVSEHLSECESWGAPRQSTPEIVDDEDIAYAEATMAMRMERDLTNIRVSKDEANAAKERADTVRESIAILGISGCYPQASNLQEFWKNLLAGRDCIAEVPLERWSSKEFYEPDIEVAIATGRSYSKWGGFLNDFAHFDARFFGITPRDATSIDPQERLFIEHCWQAMEDAGYTRALFASRHDNRVGVFAGITKRGFELYGCSSSAPADSFYPRTSFASVANRVSYLLDLQGPSMPIDTMCSASLTAVHEACEHILRGDCEMAFAGGVNLYLHESSYFRLCQSRMLSNEGRCRSFGKGGTGFVPGEGVGVVLLKKLSSAIADGDAIHAIIRATNINHGGKTSGYTVPNPIAQARLISETLKKSGVDARYVTYIEAHGTGTELGDPIEAAGLTRAFQSHGREAQFCALGSAKSNIGHLEAAAGIAGLTKVVLMMKHHVLAKSLHAEEINPNIDFEDTPFFLVRETQSWKPSIVDANGIAVAIPRIAGVSSFGAGGANAHVVVEEYVAVNRASESSQPSDLPVAVVLSAKSSEQLNARVVQLAEFLSAKNCALDVRDIAYTLQVGRELMEHRIAFVVTTIADLKERLLKYIIGDYSDDGMFRGQADRSKGSLSSFVLDEDFLGTVRNWLRRRKLSKVAEVWVSGFDVDWNILYEGLSPTRIHLPSYPFAKERYWIKADTAIAPDFKKRSSELSFKQIASADVNRKLVDDDALISLCADRLKEIISDATQIPLFELSSSTPFQEIGLDSIAIMGLNVKIERWLGRLDSTLFFKYSDIQSLGEHLAKTYAEEIIRFETDELVRTDISVVRLHGSAARRGELLEHSPLSRAGSSGVQSELPISMGVELNSLTDIAVLGISGRYPGASTLEEFWENLEKGRDCIEEIPPDRWSLEGFYEADRESALTKGLSYSKWGGFLEDVDKFDPLFFKIAPRDAELMDPQERLFMQTAWECVEEAGYTRASLKERAQGRVGVFVGATFNNYQLVVAEAAGGLSHGMYSANSQTFSISNRVSYVMGVTGPSLTVDTACSSSLYALHLACESLRGGESTMAIAGGVNLSLHPSKYILLAQKQFSAADGRCRAFSEGGSGYVPAEGVGAVLLKPLAEAVRDKDRIYGVIKGTGVSHGGATNGYTVPNPLSQAMAIERALLRSGIHPRTISYIEAHGTGTTLGDPIEIEGLSQVFRKYTDAIGFCAIASVKSNIGHAEAAAGIAQLTKVLLQLKHRKLVKNIMHGPRLNPNIDFARSPFTVQSSNQEWQRPIIEGQEYPRRAGISSFGAGGANAHVVIEEYPPTGESELLPLVESRVPRAILLSGRDEDRVRQQVKNLLKAIESANYRDADLPNIAYTLQVGREAMESRLAMMACSIEELKEKLYRYLSGKEQSAELFRGAFKKGGEKAIWTEAETDKAINAALTQEDYSTLLALWVKGYAFAWEELYRHQSPDVHPSRISLPTYPFSKQRYWATKKITLNTAAASSSLSYIHPLLHVNVSTFGEQRFSTTLTGREFFLTDHVVKGVKTLPAVAYLEMARAAIAASTGSPQFGKTILSIRNVVFASPIAVGEHPVYVHAKLQAQDDGAIKYEVYTVDADKQREFTSAFEKTHSTLRCQGLVSVSAGDTEPEFLDIRRLVSQAAAGFSGDQCYELYRTRGMHYGPAHRGVQHIYKAIDESGAPYVVAAITLPSVVAETFHQYVLHPSIVDAALQALIGLSTDHGVQSNSEPVKSIVPFAIERLDVIGACTQSAYAYVRRCGGNQADENFDIDICDAKGLIFVRLRGFAIDWHQFYTDSKSRRMSLPTYPFGRDRYCVERALTPAQGIERERLGGGVEDESDERIAKETERTAVEGTGKERVERLLFIEEWQVSEGSSTEEDVGATVLEGGTMHSHVHTVVVISDERHRSVFSKVIAKLDERTQVVSINPGLGASSYREAFSRAVAEYGSVDVVWYVQEVSGLCELDDQREILALIQGLAGAGIREGKVLLAGGYRSGIERCKVESWIGYARSLKQVLPGIQMAVIQAEREESGLKEESRDGRGVEMDMTSRWIEWWAQRLWVESQEEQIESALYIRERRHVLRILPMDISTKGTTPVLRSGGVYLITGGLGGLGYVFARHLAKQYLAKLILTGRSALDAGKQAKLETLSTLGGQAIYMSADVNDRELMRHVLAHGRERFGALHGVIHAAGVEGRGSVLSKEPGSMAAVLAPKITGTVVLSELLAEQKRQSVQPSEPTGDTELDFICYCSSASAILGDFGSCDYAVGNRFELAYAKYVENNAMAICWPLWADGGMGLGNEAATQLYLKSSGQQALRATEGVAIFEQLLAQHRTSGIRHGLVMVGDKRRIDRLLGLAPLVIETSKVRSESSLRRPDLQGLTLNQSVLWELTELASELLKLSHEQLDAQTNLAEFGFDSIGLVTLAKRLSAHYRIEILPSVFFSHATLHKLGMYLLAEHGEALRQKHGEQSAPPLAVRSQHIAVRSAGERKSMRTAASVSASQSPSAQRADRPEPIAIIGMSGRFPGARSVAELWRILVEGKEVIQEIPLERFDWRGYYVEQPADQPASATLRGKTISKWLGVLPGVEEFDPLFFEISPREAQLMDPRQRLLLQESFKALEDAGYGTSQLSVSNIGMFVGVEQGNYQLLLDKHQDDGSITANHDAILASRLSYFLNLRGPAMAINTACSSGLVALHQACLSLRADECDAALAAGVNLILTPHSYVGMSQAGMLSPDGKCYAFDRRANGIVPGEAVVALVIKRLSQAEADGDVIRAVIRGSGINYDGKTNGLTAPNGTAQTELIQDVYRRAHVNPKDIDYLVTHGTGTRLGDPVEINALRDAFKDVRSTEPFCALTSTKTNLGHTFAASGLVSLVSLVQALEHEMIPASLHCEELSDYIDWTSSPFYVNTRNKPWPNTPDKPRLGAVSAFGMSGTNAHVVVESYDSTVHLQSSGSTPVAPYYLLLLSAKTEAALQQRARDLIGVLEDERLNWDAQQFAALNYALLNHRQHFNHRCAMVIEDRAQAAALLRKVLEGEKLQMLLQGKVARNFTEQLMLREYAEELIGRLIGLHDDPSRYQHSLASLGELYCQGYQLNWQALCDGHSPCRVSLPTYPFAKERYWVSINATSVASSSASGDVEDGTSASVLHPLVQANTSNLSAQRFSSVFSGAEFFLKDHVIGGERVLPGVAYLEMAREAIKRAMQDEDNDSSFDIELKHVVWSRPMVVKQEGISIRVEIYPEESGEISYEICSEISGEERIVYSQGRGVRVNRDVQELRKGNERIDVRRLRESCEGSVVEAQCYAAFERLGFSYGPAHRGLRSIQVGRDGEGQRYVVGEVALPSCVVETQARYVLHPSVLDSALQAAMGLGFERGEEASSAALGRPSVPFALERLEVFAPSPAHAVVYVRASVGYEQGEQSEKVRKLDIDICNEDGEVCVRLRGFSSRVLEGEAGERGALLLERSWVSGPRGAVEERQAAEGGVHWVLLDSRYRGSVAELQAEQPHIRYEVLAEQGSLIERMRGYSEQVLVDVQSLLKMKVTQGLLFQVVLAEGAESELLRSLSGLLKSASQENPRFSGQVVTVEAGESARGLSLKLQESGDGREDQEIRYRGDERWVVQLKELAGDAEAALRMPWRAGGVYVLTGGLGGLGVLFVKELMQRAPDARVILVGRSALSAEQQGQLAGWAVNGAQLEYRSVDVTEAASIGGCIRQIEAQHGGINGVIHAAGVLKDSYLMKKTVDELRRVMAPKVSGLINLDEATGHMQLDFFVAFSSTASVFGNVGQGDYALANAFMDRYMEYRCGLVESGARYGRSVSINWPLWEAGGMGVDAATRRRMRESFGLLPLGSEQGIELFYRALSATAVSQVAVVVGEVGRLRGRLLRRAPPIVSVSSEVQAPIKGELDTEALLDKVQTALVQSISTLLKVRVEEIEVEAELSEFGFDSITLTEFGNRLHQAYRLELTPTIFFEYPTVRSFAEYLVQAHGEQLSEQLSVRSRVSGVSAGRLPADGVPMPRSSARGRGRFSAVGWSEPVAASGVEPIAIIGMSGCLPGARELGEFWENLVSGQSSIAEIPSDRWDWRAWYGDPTQEANKTNIKWGGFIDGIAEFDPLFFGISPREAQLMDPQQRLLMLYVWKAIEDAGYSAQSLSGSQTAIFVGTGSSGYGALIAQAKTTIEGYSSTGAVPSVGPNRMSYFLNLHGPSEPIETACSSSLVAIHRAVRAMRSGDCELAIVGGINTIVTPTAHISFNKAGMLSEDGRCKTFSKEANGYVRGEGVGMLLLKKVSAAEREGDHIYGVIRGSSENHGGRANSLTAPNPKAQAELIKAAYREAQIDPRTVGYIEAHGTGTSLGDPVEVNGLKSAFKALYEMTGDSTTEVEAAHCGLGSVKTNIGHLELAAGVAGVIKVLLQLKHRTLVKSLHCEELNPYIQLQGSPFYVVQETQPWRALQDRAGRELPRRAGISSFGFGGSNAHVVIEEYCALQAPVPSVVVSASHPALIVLSAKNEERLREQARQLLEHLHGQTQVAEDLGNIAYTLQVGREAMEHRLALTVTSVESLQEKLQQWLQGETGIDELYQGEVKKNKETLSIFTADEDLQTAMSAWIEKGKYAKLLELWVKGLVFDWQQLYVNATPRRLSLPTYPFAKERHWIGKPSTVELRGTMLLEAKSQWRPALFDELLDAAITNKLSVKAAAEKIKETMFS